MRVMNDNLIAKIVHTWALFISIWLQTTLPTNVHGYADGLLNVEQNFCTGTFNDHEQMMNLYISCSKLSSHATTCKKVYQLHKAYHAAWILIGMNKEPRATSDNSFKK